MASSSRVQLEAWLSKKEIGGMILDIGGAQEPLNSKRIGILPGSEIKILDLPNPHEEKVKADIECDLNLPINEGWDSTFDVVACLEVSEYFYDPLTAFKNMAKLLKKGGRLLTSFHFYYPTHAPEGLDYLRYTEFGATKILQEAGFEVVEKVDRMCGEYKVNPLDVFNAAEKTHPLKRYDHRKIGVLVEAIKK